jgi:UDP-N-acetylmuramyl pentapeptide phosphotransferase/UDP-N-acetylglucosamine-1-phosphate transferase
MRELSLAPAGLILLAYALGLSLTMVMRALLLKRAMLDHPNERSAHKIPVPRGGGWALALILIPGMLLMGWAQKDMAAHASLIVGTVILVFVSWLDDRLSSQGGVSIVARLSTHIAAACLGSLAFSPQYLMFAGALPFWLDRSLMIIAWAWFINLYNFMDGIDGITGAETVSIATGTCLIMTAANLGDPFADTLTLLLIGACLGFLALNWHPAKIFLGDVGSVTLGYLTGFLLLTLAVKGQRAPALILPLYYLTDSGITLIKRILRGEKFWQPHCKHFYQRAAQAAGRHDTIVLWIVIADIGLIGAALLAVAKSAVGLVLAVLIVAILLRRMHKAVR